MLRPGGQLYLADLHPARAQLEEEDGKLVFKYRRKSRGGREAIPCYETRSYAGDKLDFKHRWHFEWIHPISDILDGLKAVGLQLVLFHEHDIIPWPAVPSMIPASDSMYRLPGDMLGSPVVFSLMACKSFDV